MNYKFNICIIIFFSSFVFLQGCVSSDIQNKSDFEICSKMQVWHYMSNFQNFPNCIKLACQSQFMNQGNTYVKCISSLERFERFSKNVENERVARRLALYFLSRVLIDFNLCYTVRKLIQFYMPVPEQIFDRNYFRFCFASFTVLNLTPAVNRQPGFRRGNS